MIVLVNPPVVKPSEPPPGVFKLLAAMNAHGVGCTVWDANIDCLLNLLHKPRTPETTWTTRAIRGLKRNLHLLKTPDGYQNFDRYKRAVSDINHLLETSEPNASVQISLTDYKDPALSPVKSRDLLASAETPEKNLFFPFFSNSFEKLLTKNNPTVVGFSLNYFSQALTTFAMIGFLKHKNPSVKILVGGGLITSWLRRPGWKTPFAGLIDEMVVGPGENALLFHATGKTFDLKPVMPDYGSVAMRDYLAPGPIVPYSTSSGCYWNKCGFCPERTEKNPYIPIPVQRVTEELGQLVTKHSPILIHILDNALSPALMEQLAKYPPGVPWYGFTRFTPHLADEDFCMGLKRSGCVMLQLGLESGDQKLLDAEKKGINLEIASRALRTLKKTGISTYIYLLFGTPSETLQAARKTLAYVTAHAAFIDFLNIAIFNLPIDSPEAGQLLTDAFSEGDLSLYSNFIHPNGWDRRQVRQFLDKEFKRHPAIAPIVRNDPPFFTSNHTPFFCRGL